MTAADVGIEVLAIGRVSVDLYPLQAHVPLAAVDTFQKAVGGTATNLAIAAARLGHRTAIVTKVGADGFGDFVRQALEGFGVDPTWVGTDPDHRTPLAFAELDPPEDPGLLFYREPHAPDERIEPDDIPWDLVEAVDLLWVPGSRFAFEPSATTVRSVLERRGRRRHTVLDLDYRPMFWPSAETAAAAIGAAIEHATVAVGNREETRVAVGSEDPDGAADRLLDRGVEWAIVKLGAEGVLVATADGIRERVPPIPVDVVCGLGAGDAFGGMLCHGLLSGWDPVRTIRHANAAGAIVAGRLMCSDAMPAIDEVQAVAADARVGS